MLLLGFFVFNMKYSFNYGRVAHWHHMGVLGVVAEFGGTAECSCASECRVLAVGSGVGRPWSAGVRSGVDVVLPPFYAPWTPGSGHSETLSLRLSVLCQCGDC